jgi:uncharacterized protein YkwD
MQRPTRVLIAGLMILSVGSGGLALVQANGPAAARWLNDAQGDEPAIDAAPLLGAVRPVDPTATPTPSPTSPPRPTPSRSSPAPHPSTSKPKPKPKPTAPAADSSLVNQMLAQINSLRAQHGLPAYTLLSGLIKSAHLHNLTMMGSCGMQHQCPGEAAVGDRISAQGVRWTACGENIGWSGPHPNTNSAILGAAEGLTTAMYNEKPPDDGHRLNLLSTAFHHIGIDVVRDSSGKVWLTQDFSS